MLVKYVRDEEKKPVGAVVALSRGMVGWSKLNPKDKWDRNKALMIAKNRAEKCSMKGYEVLHNAPLSILDDFYEMDDRAERYFK